jgi:tRNA (mo5U34)-methyltransferase
VAVGAVPTSSDDPSLQGWYHTIDLGKGVHSTGWYDLRRVVDNWGIPASLQGMTALDAGTADGFFAFEMERRGADRVIAVDVPTDRDQDWLPSLRDERPAHNPNTDRFLLAHGMLGSSVEHRPVSVYSLAPEDPGTFDVVFCGSLLLHLRDPLTALIKIRSVTRRMAIIETAVDPELDDLHPGRPWMRFGNREYEERLGDHCTYWTFSTIALQDMLEYAGFASFDVLPAFELPPRGLRVRSIRAYVDPALGGELPRPRMREAPEADSAAELQRLNDELARIQASRSWRATAPLRGFARRLRSLRR